MKYEIVQINDVDVAVRSLTVNWSATFILGESQITVCSPSKAKVIAASEGIIMKDQLRLDDTQEDVDMDDWGVW